MSKFENNQCPKCGHIFSNKELLFWGTSTVKTCPNCGAEVGISGQRSLLLWPIGIIIFLPVKTVKIYESPWYWAALAGLVALFFYVSIKQQKIELKNES